jgi:hypothetical protein
MITAEVLDQLPDLCGAGSGQVCLANLFRVRRRFPGKTFFAEFTAPVPPGFARMVLVDPHDMDSSGIPVLENTRAPRLDHAKRGRPQLPGHALAGAAGLCGSCSLRRAARDGQAAAGSQSTASLGPRMPPDQRLNLVNAPGQTPIPSLITNMRLFPQISRIQRWPRRCCKFLLWAIAPGRNK